MSQVRSPVLFHPLNLLMLTSTAISGAWTMDIRPVLVGVAAEGVWLIVGSVLEARRRRNMRTARGHPVDEQEQAQVRELSEDLRRRFLELDRVRADIHRLADTQPLLEDVGLSQEMKKIDTLVADWLRLGVRLTHREAIASANDINALQKALNEASEEDARVTAFERLEAAQAAQAAVETSDAELRKVEEVLRTVRDRVALVSTSSLARPISELTFGVDSAIRAIRDVEELERHSAISAGRRARTENLTSS